jgi:hypothetical protein
MHEQLTQFLRSDTRFTWRTLPAIMRGRFMLQDVLEALKSAPSAYDVRIGQQGDLYLKAN